MPYIKRKTRALYGGVLNRIDTIGIKTEGDLEFLICSLQDTFMTGKGKGFRYTWLRRCWGATAHAAHEFRRRFLDRREDDAFWENGEVFLRMERMYKL